MKVNGSMGRETVKVSKSGLMAPHTKASGNKGASMAKELLIMSMETLTQVIGFKTRNMAKEHSNTNLELSIPVTGLKIKKMGLARTSGQMVHNMKEVITKALSMVKVFLLTRMVTYTKENYFKINSTVMVLSPGRVMERSTMGSGRTTK